MNELPVASLAAVDARKPGAFQMATNWRILRGTRIPYQSGRPLANPGFASRRSPLQTSGRIQRRHHAFHHLAVRPDTARLWFLNAPGMRDITCERLALVKTSGMKPSVYAGQKAGYGGRVMIVPLSKVQLRQDEDGVWIAKSSLLPGCHAHGHDRGEAALRFQEAAKAHLEALLETGRPIPPAFRDKFVLAA